MESKVLLARLEDEEPGEQASAQGDSLHGQGKQKPDPVTDIASRLKKDRAVLLIDYYYDQEAGDDVRFELRPVAGRNGCEGVFRVTRSSSSRSKDVLDVSKVIENAVLNRVVVKKKKLKKSFYRVKFAKPKDLDLAQYFMTKSDRLSSSDEEKR